MTLPFLLLSIISVSLLHFYLSNCNFVFICVREKKYQLLFEYGQERHSHIYPSKVRELPWKNVYIKLCTAGSLNKCLSSNNIAQYLTCRILGNALPRKLRIIRQIAYLIYFLNTYIFKPPPAPLIQCTFTNILQFLNNLIFWQTIYQSRPLKSPPISW